MGVGSEGVVNYANTYPGSASHVNATGSVGDFEVIVGGNVAATLSLDFQTMTTFDPRITFSRTTNATLIWADGNIVYAPHNLLTYSENFDNAVWNKTVSASVASNTVTSPDGSITADTVTLAGAAQGIYQAVSGLTPATTYTMSMYVKLGSMSASDYKFAVYDATNGAFINQDWPPDQPVSSSEWTRVIFNFGTPAGCTSVYIYPVRNTATVNGSVYIWGAQVNITSFAPADYYTTSVKNLLGYSQNFENAAWTKSNSTIDATPVMGPLGFLGAEKLVESAVAGEHNIAEAVTYVAGTPYTLSVYAKAGERDFVVLSYGSGAFGVTTSAYFNLATGAVGTTVNSPTVSIISVGGGWYRCSITKTATVSAAANTIINETSADGVLSYTGDGSSGIYIFGAQLSDSASLDPYSYNFGAAPTSTAYYGPRFDYDPVTLAPKGLLIEEQRTNLIFPSIPPIATSGTLLIGAGITAKVANAALSPDGTVNATSYTSVQGNSNSGAGSSIRWLNGITTAGSYTISFYAKGLAGGETVSVRFVDSGAAYDTTIACSVSDGGNNTMTTSWRRYYATATLPAGSTAFYSIITLGANTDTTYMWGFQFEAGAFPTSYIPTTSASVTRAADNVSMIGTNFSSWYNQSEGTFVTSSIGSSTAGIIVSANNGTTSERVQISYGAGSGGNINLTVTDGGVLQAQPLIGSITPTNLNKTAATYKRDYFALSVNGITPAVDTVGTIPAPDRLTIGMSGAGATQINGYIQSINYYPTRLSNGTLQRLTS